MALTQKILENREFTNLPRKFNVVISGCPFNCVDAETQDLALIPAARQEDEKEILGFNVLAGGKLGSGGYRIATSLDIFVRPEEAVEVCSEIIGLYRDYGNRETPRCQPVCFSSGGLGRRTIPPGTGEAGGAPPDHCGGGQASGEKAGSRGYLPQKQFGMNFVGLKVVTGRIKAEQFRQVGVLAERYGTGEVRLTPGQNVVLPHVTDKRLGDLLDEPLLEELLYAPFGSTRHLVACVGSDYCSLAAIETKSRAKEVAEKVDSKFEKIDPVSIHWSGCPAGCGNHLVADIGLLGKRARVGGKVVDAVDIYVGGRTGPSPKLATRLMENVPCDQLPEVLSHLVPYHTREKMHPTVERKSRRGKARMPQDDEDAPSDWRLEKRPA